MARTLWILVAVSLAIGSLPTASAEHPYALCHLGPAGQVCSTQHQEQSGGPCGNGGYESNRTRVAYYGAEASAEVMGFDNCGPGGRRDGLTVNVWESPLLGGVGLRVDVSEENAPANRCELEIFLTDREGTDLFVPWSIRCPGGFPNPGWGHLPP